MAAASLHILGKIHMFRVWGFLFPCYSSLPGQANKSYSLIFHKNPDAGFLSQVVKEIHCIEKTYWNAIAHVWWRSRRYYWYLIHLFVCLTRLYWHFIYLFVYYIFMLPIYPTRQLWEAIKQVKKRVQSLKQHHVKILRIY